MPPVSWEGGRPLRNPAAAEGFACQTLLPVRFRMAGSRRAFAAGGLHTTLGPTSITYMWSHGRYVASRSTDDTGSDEFLLTWCIEGGMEINATRSALATAGDLILIPCHGEMEFAFAEAIATLSIRLPACSGVRSIGRDAIESLLCRPIDGRTGAGALVRDLMLSIWQHRGALDAAAADIVVDTVGKLLRTRAEATRRGHLGLSLSRQSVVMRVRDHVTRHLGNRTALAPAAVAAQVGRSIRTVQSALQAAGTSLQRLILEERLEAAS